MLKLLKNQPPNLPRTSSSELDLSSLCVVVGVGVDSQGQAGDDDAVSEDREHSFYSRNLVLHIDI